MTGTRKTSEVCGIAMWANFRLVRSRVRELPKADRLAYYRAVREGFLGPLFELLRQQLAEIEAAEP